MIQDSVNRISYDGNGIATEFAFPFSITTTNDVKVMLVDANGTETILTSDYTVDDVNSKVTYPGYPAGEEPPLEDRPPILAAGRKIVIYRELDVTQLTSLFDQYPFKTIEAMIDKTTILLQQINDAQKRALTLSVSTGTDVSPALPTPSPLKSFRWNAAGTGIETTLDPASVIPAVTILKETAETAAETAIAKAKTATEQAVISTDQATISTNKAVEATGAAATIGGFLNYTATAKTLDVITKGPWVDVRAFGAVAGDTTAVQMTINTTAFNQAVQSGCKVFIPKGVYSINGRIDLSLAPHNSYNIEGCGESTVISCVGATAGLYDKYGSQDNRNYHTKSMRNFQLQGDMTNIGFECSSLNLFADSITIMGFERGIYVHNGGYDCTFNNFIIRDNHFGIYVGSLVTTLTFDNVNIEAHADETGAGVYFNYYVENVKIAGIIASNHAPAVWYDTGFSGTVEFNVYFELNGNRDNGTPSIKNDATAGTILYRNSKIPNNTSGAWKSGVQQIGHDVICDNCRLTTKLFIGNSLAVANSIIDSGGGVIPEKISTFIGRMRFGTLWGDGGSNGFAFQLPPLIKECSYDLLNKQLNPFPTSAAIVTATGSNAPTVTLDTVNTFCEKNSNKIVFADNVVGAVGNNCVYLRGNSTGLTTNGGNLYVVSFFAKANQIGNVFANVTAGGGPTTPIQKEITLDTSWRKYIFIGKNLDTVARTAGCYLWCSSALTGFEVNITGICLYENVAINEELLSKMLDGQLKYYNNLVGSLVWDPASLANGASVVSSAITVTGAAFGDFVTVSAPYSLQGIICTGYVSAANTAVINLQNSTGAAIDLASGAWKVKVNKY